MPAQGKRGTCVSTRWPKDHCDLSLNTFPMGGHRTAVGTVQRCPKSMQRHAFAAVGLWVCGQIVCRRYSAETRPAVDDGRWQIKLQHLLPIRVAQCSPSYNGVPVSATFLMRQAISHFETAFPLLEMSPVFAMGPAFPQFSYREGGLVAFIWPTSATIEVPIFERLSEVEEARLGGAGLRKKPVGRLILHGSCNYGCASVKLVSMKVLKLNGELVWEKKL